MDRCEKCGGRVTMCVSCGHEHKPRSTEISTRFHGWITFCARKTAMKREQIQWEVLLLATEIEVDGASPWPYEIVRTRAVSVLNNELIEVDMVHPSMSTSGRTNKQMMTAIGALEQWASEREIYLPESEVI